MGVIRKWGREDGWEKEGKEAEVEAVLRRGRMRRD